MRRRCAELDLRIKHTVEQGGRLDRKSWFYEGTEAVARKQHYRASAVFVRQS
jgi:hypothetical protein